MKRLGCSYAFALLLLSELVHAQAIVEFHGDVPAFEERAVFGVFE